MVDPPELKMLPNQRPSRLQRAWILIKAMLVFLGLVGLFFLTFHFFGFWKTTAILGVAGIWFVGVMLIELRLMLEHLYCPDCGEGVLVDRRKNRKHDGTHV